MIARLQRQIAHVTSDDFVRERAAPYRTMSPAECWAETVALCGGLDQIASWMEPATRARALEREPMSDELCAILEAVQRSR